MNESVLALIAIHTVIGAGTIYTAPVAVTPLFCSTPNDPYTFDSLSPPWVAMPFSEYDKSWQCGDLIYVRSASGSLLARALDAGPFSNYCIRQPDGTCISIVVDVPGHLATWDGLSAEVEVINLSAVARACRERGYCD